MPIDPGLSMEKLCGKGIDTFDNCLNCLFFIRAKSLIFARFFWSVKLMKHQNHCTALSVVLHVCDGRIITRVEFRGTEQSQQCGQMGGEGDRQHKQDDILAGLFFFLCK